MIFFKQGASGLKDKIQLQILQSNENDIWDF